MRPSPECVARTLYTGLWSAFPSFQQNCSLSSLSILHFLQQLQDSRIFQGIPSWLNFQIPSCLFTETLFFLTFPSNGITFQRQFFPTLPSKVSSKAVCHHLTSSLLLTMIFIIPIGPSEPKHITCFVLHFRHSLLFFSCSFIPLLIVTYCCPTSPLSVQHWSSTSLVHGVKKKSNPKTSIHPSIGTVLCAEHWCCRSSFLGDWAQFWMGHRSDTVY